MFKNEQIKTKENRNKIKVEIIKKKGELLQKYARTETTASRLLLNIFF